MDGGEIMGAKEEGIPVVFRKFKDYGNIIALFPTLEWNDVVSECTSYMRIGQHGAFNLDGLSNTVLATEEEYADLLEELESIGYDNLVIYKRIQKWMFFARLGDF